MCDNLFQRLEGLLLERECNSTFSELTNFNINYKELFDQSITVGKYWQSGHGIRTIGRELQEKNHSYANYLQGGCDFKGLYIFCTDCGHPFYVGISRKVISRINQHVKGTTHYSASLAYLMYRKIDPIYIGNRNDAPFEEYRTRIQNFLKEQRVILIRVDDDDELYLREFQFAIELKTGFNSFMTH